MSYKKAKVLYNEKGKFYYLEFEIGETLKNLNLNIALNKPVFSAKPTPIIVNRNITNGVNDIKVVSTLPIMYLAPSLENNDSTETN